jgi:hypothetical protein
MAMVLRFVTFMNTFPVKTAINFRSISTNLSITFFMLWFDAVGNDDTSASNVSIYQDVKGWRL